MQLLAHALLSVLLGVIASGIARTIDDWMDYGNILGFVRYWIFWAIATPGELVSMYAAKEVPGFQERTQAMSEVYWTIAYRVTAVKVLICTVCLSFYACLAVFALAVHREWIELGILEFVSIAAGNYLALVITTR